ncbi:MAG: hypothetical protein HYW62_00445 [Candidatus Levybacteria bacterium]|nr:hypothetical protein [Candidatus Levybacteria bacterium]
MTELGIGRKEILSQRERLSDEQLGNLISAVGNLEGKAITLLLMEQGRIYSKGNLYHKFMGAQEERIGWKPDRAIPFQYCQFSLLPIGLVALGEKDHDLKTWGYGVTPYGEEEGIPLAGLLLDFSEKHPEFSLSQVFGSTNSPSQPKNIQTPEGETEFKSRSPILRLKIFRKLIAAKLPIRESDLASTIGENAGMIGRHLALLADSHIISYESIRKDQPQSFYALSSEKPNERLTQHSAFSSLTEKVYSFFLNLGPSKQITLEDITDSLIAANSEMGKLNKQALKRRISTICSYLAKQHYLVQGKFKEGLESEITLSDTQKATLLELVALINRFQGQEPEILEEGRRKAMKIIHNPHRVSHLLRKAKESSGRANKLSQGEGADFVLSLIKEHPGASVEDIFKFQDRKPRLSMANIGVIVHRLRGNDRVSVSRRTVKNRFTAVDSEREN